MAFTTKEFPNKVFETIEEYEALLRVKERLKNELQLKTATSCNKVVKVAGIIRQRDSRVQALIQWILRYLKT